MRRRYIDLALILIILAAAIWANVPGNPGISIGNFNRSMQPVLGLDLRGGLQVLMQADVTSGTSVNPADLQTAVTILENRANALGVSEVSLQVAGSNRIVGQFPGLKDPEQVLSVLKETGVLEFVDMDSSPVAEGTIVKTDLATSASSPTSSTTPSTSEATNSPTLSASATALPTTAGTAQTTAEAAIAAQTTPAASPTTSPADHVYHTVMTGDQLATVNVSAASVGGQYVVNFTLKPAGQKVFADFTSANVGKYLAIVLDKKVVSVPKIDTAITQGSGEITGNFTYQTANDLAVQLRYGSLPIALKIVQTQVVGPTLGQDSINKSERAGIIGLLVIILFMILYYRLPGFIADLALLMYALVSLSLFKLIPVTLTLPGIAGFVLSIGMAVDANILIFERLKEELRAGRTLEKAIDLGWRRAWLSIRDSNISTLITCLILFWFGSNFGASLVKGFSITLALGVIVSLFTALFVTRTFLHVVLDNIKFVEHPKWFGA
ncbi:MAG TPA: protein translocase subunit SecD [Anaerolineaceae bacterium]|nr:protein translocase subunit SecD [Anaerolineaceae bacterium]